MKVNLMGFHLKFPKSELSHPEGFYKFLRQPDGNSHKNCVLAACNKSHDGKKWIGGVLITDKNAKNIALKIKRGGKFTVKPQELGKDTTVTDFNFFVYHPDTQRGIYQSYYRSSTINQFLLILDFFYREHKIAILGERQERGPMPDPEFNRLRKDANTHLEGSVIVKRDELPKLIEQFDRIKNIEVEFSSFSPAQQGDLTALSSHAKQHLHVLRYSQDGGRIIKKKAIEFFSQNEHVEKILKKAKLVGITPGGLENVYKLANNPDKLGEADYDDWIRDVSLDSADWDGCLQKAGIIQKLLHVTDEKRVKAILLTTSE